MKKISNLLVLVLVIFNLTITISFPFITVSYNTNTNTETTTVSVSDLVGETSVSEENIVTLQSHFPTHRVNVNQ
ncbi:hypothetical protein [Butyrivibrio sp. AE2015]|uniref:hypothetical protein n=1 Tax=Butyrivibrio sp. AE2015 TaxID=1280663 RepID=UPI0003B60609|nr:hypothetical protein [Butyrivibrio sp. AE2015]